MLNIRKSAACGTGWGLLNRQRCQKHPTPLLLGIIVFNYTYDLALQGLPREVPPLTQMSCLDSGQLAAGDTSRQNQQEG